MQDNMPWWKTTTIYQIYPRSFKDSNGDGIGDLKGIISKLDYVKELGFETIWFSPFFASPQEDFGYDIAGYREIAPEYGTLADAELLIHEIHKRGMKVIFDLVLNHTSNQHPWFIESSKSRDNPKADWYIWRDGKGRNRPPNNWKALPGGSGWHHHPDRDQWYYASFLPFQPDLNFRNPEVKQEMFDTAKFWLNKGLDGFRLDIFHAIFKAEHFQDNPFHWSYIPKNEKFGFFTEWKYTVNQPETIQLAHEMRSLMEEYSPDRFMVGEIFCDDETVKKYLGDTTDGMHSIFLWDLMNFKFNAEFFWGVLNSYETWYPPPYVPILVLGNHDSLRWIDRVGYDLGKAKLIALLQLTSRGIPVVYYGEEIGLPEGKISANDALDPVGKRYAWAPDWLLNLLNIYINRDNCRTPMIWEKFQQGGFTNANAEPWLLLSADPKENNVADQLKQPDSILNWYQELLHFRNSNPALQAGELSLLTRDLTKKGLLGFTRTHENESLTVLINFGTESVEIPTQAEQIILKTGEVDIRENKIVLSPRSGAILT